MSMKRFCLVSAVLSALLILVASASAQTKSGVDKLYILNCGDGVAGDISRWSPGSTSASRWRCRKTVI